MKREGGKLLSSPRNEMFFQTNLGQYLVNIFPVTIKSHMCVLCDSFRDMRTNDIWH